VTKAEKKEFSNSECGGDAGKIASIEDPVVTRKIRAIWLSVRITTCFFTGIP
jgi:hypothetical protein